MQYLANTFGRNKKMLAIMALALFAIMLAAPAFADDASSLKTVFSITQADLEKILTEGATILGGVMLVGVGIAAGIFVYKNVVSITKRG